MLAKKPQVFDFYMWPKRVTDGNGKETLELELVQVVKVTDTSFQVRGVLNKMTTYDSEIPISWATDLVPQEQLVDGDEHELQNILRFASPLEIRDGLTKAAENLRLSIREHERAIRREQVLMNDTNSILERMEHDEERLTA